MRFFTDDAKADGLNLKMVEGFLAEMGQEGRIVRAPHRADHTQGRFCPTGKRRPLIILEEAGFRRFEEEYKNHQPEGIWRTGYWPPHEAPDHS